MVHLGLGSGGGGLAVVATHQPVPGLAQAVALDMAKRLRSGNVGLNTLQRNHEAPFGGFKQSGVGRDGGSYGLHAYSELQSIVWSS